MKRPFIPGQRVQVSDEYDLWQLDQIYSGKTQNRTITSRDRQVGTVILTLDDRHAMIHFDDPAEDVAIATEFLTHAFQVGDRVKWIDECGTVIAIDTPLWWNAEGYRIAFDYGHEERLSGLDLVPTDERQPKLERGMRVRYESLFDGTGEGVIALTGRSALNNAWCVRVKCEDGHMCVFDTQQISVLTT